MYVYPCVVWGASVPVCGSQRTTFRGWSSATSLLRHGLLFLLGRIVQARQPVSFGRIFLSAFPLPIRMLGWQMPRTTSGVSRVLQAHTATAFPAATSLPPTFSFYSLQTTQGLTNRISIKVNCKGLSTPRAACLPTLPYLTLAIAGPYQYSSSLPSPASQRSQHSETSTNAGNWVINS